MIGPKSMRCAEAAKSAHADRFLATSLSEVLKFAESMKFFPKKSVFLGVEGRGA